MRILMWLIVVTVCVAPAWAQGLKMPAGSTTIRLWPKEALPLTGKEPPEKGVVGPHGEGKIIRVQHVSDPTITICPAPKAKAEKPAPAVVICPGGGYGILAWDLEGLEVAAWLNKLGVTGVVLKYRVPRKRDLAFQDAQRALGMVRSRAKEWNVDPARIGILGFSAGGHLAARASTNWQKRAYKAVDKHDETPCRPDFSVLIYPAYLTTKGDAAVDTATLPIAKDTPGTFIAIAGNDRFTPGALLYYAALRKAKVRSELHVFQFGGHGCGLRPTSQSVTSWPRHCEVWLRGLKVIGE